MKNILTPILLVGLLFLCYPSFSQNLQWSFRADAGLSVIPYFNDQNTEISFINSIEDVSKPAFTWSYGSTVESQISKNWFLSTGVSFTVLRDKRTSSFPLILQFDPTSPISVPEPDINNSIERVTIIKSSNISIPFSLKYKPNKLGIYTGIQTLYNIESNMTYRQFLRVTDPFIGFEDSTISIPFAIKTWDFGVTGGLSYNFNNYLSIQSTLYWGLRNIAIDFSDNFERYNRSLTIGLSYHFI